jgi:small nuclear ribonucleoprotein (snRNP)-like protein
MKSEREFTGTLAGFDDYVNMVLEDATEQSVASCLPVQRGRFLLQHQNGQGLCPEPAKAGIAQRQQHSNAGTGGSRAVIALLTGT